MTLGELNKKIKEAGGNEDTPLYISFLSVGSVEVEEGCAYLMDSEGESEEECNEEECNCEDKQTW